jgi:hypothetical protein
MNTRSDSSYMQEAGEILTPFGGGMTTVKNLLALVVAIAFTACSVGLAAAQTQMPAPAAKAEMKKMPVKNANGTVKAASADSIVVAGKERKKETEWTFGVDPKTSIRRGGKSITAADLKPGDAVHVRYMDMDGKAVAQSIMVKGGGMAKKETKK